MQLRLTLYQPGREGAPGEERLCLCVAECLCYSAETATLNQPYPDTNVSGVKNKEIRKSESSSDHW